MALKRISQLPALTGVVAGDTATLDIPIGPRYQVLWLRVSDGNNADASTIIDELRLKVNGKVQRIMTIAELDGLNSLMNDPAYNVITQDGGTKAITQARSIVTPGAGMYSIFKTAAKVTYVPIFFAEPWRPFAVAEELAWGTGNLSTFQLEVDVAAAANAPVIQAYAEVDNAVITTNGLSRAVPMGLITKWDRLQVAINSTKLQWQGLKLPAGDTLLSLHFIDANISNVAIKADSYEWRDLSQADNQIVLHSRRMTPRSTAYDVILDYDDIPGGAGLKLDGVRDFRVNLDLSDGTPRNIAVLVQSLGNPN